MENNIDPAKETPLNRILPSRFQLGDKIFVDFGRGQKVGGTIHGIMFYDPAIYYEVMIRISNDHGHELYTYIEVPAGIVIPAEAKESA